MHGQVQVMFYFKSEEKIYIWFSKITYVISLGHILKQTFPIDISCYNHSNQGYNYAFKM